MTVATALALVSAIGIGVIVVQFVTRGSGRASLPSGYAVRAAHAPFAGFRETDIRVNERCARVVVADTEARREQGLRGHGTPGSWGEYAAMLFVARDDTTTAFTMAGVTAPLEISWYTADGKRLDGAHMDACPDRDESHCPLYRSRRAYRLALETAGGFPSGAQIAPCG